MSRQRGADVSAIITAHAEGPLAGPSFRNLVDTVAAARRDGLEVDVLVVLDNPDAATLETFAEAEQHAARVEQVSYADHGLVRNHAARLVDSDYIAFLDGDDLWSENWLTEAHKVCQRDPGKVIAHPEVNWFFGESGFLYFLPDQTDPDFDLAYLRVANPWDALCMAPVAAYTDVPHSKRAIAEGFAFDDWHWNMETLDAGFVHRVVPETIHFKRRRAGSQFTVANANRSLTRPSPMLDYAWWEEGR